MPRSFYVTQTCVIDKTAVRLQKLILVYSYLKTQMAVAFRMQNYTFFHFLKILNNNLL